MNQFLMFDIGVVTSLVNTLLLFRLENLNYKCFILVIIGYDYIAGILLFHDENVAVAQKIQVLMTSPIK